MKIFIRYGHEILANGNNTSADGILNEYTVIRDYAPKVADYLQQLGHEVKIFNPSPQLYSSAFNALYAGVVEANKWSADLFISCHVNAFDDPKADGTEVLYYENSAKGEDIAINISKEISLALDTILRRGNGAYASTFYELRKTKMPAVIIEPFFCTSPSDCQKYDSDKIARAIVKGLTGEELSTTFYRVITGSFTYRDNAEAQVERLKLHGVNAFIDYSNGYYRVIASSYTLRENAEKQLLYLKSIGYDAFVAVYLL